MGLRNFKKGSLALVVKRRTLIGYINGNAHCVLLDKFQKVITSQDVPFDETCTSSDPTAYNAAIVDKVELYGLKTEYVDFEPKNEHLGIDQAAGYNQPQE